MGDMEGEEAGDTEGEVAAEVVWRMQAGGVAEASLADAQWTLGGRTSTTGVSPGGKCS